MLNGETIWSEIGLPKIVCIFDFQVPSFHCPPGSMTFLTDRKLKKSNSGIY